MSVETADYRADLFSPEFQMLNITAGTPAIDSGKDHQVTSTA
jgi:hypothetical protein